MVDPQKIMIGVRQAMKKTIRFFAIAVAFAAMAACNKEQDIVEVPSIVEDENTPAATSYDPAKYLTGFGAAMEETKADLADATGDFSWTNGDQVKVIRSDGQEALYAYSESRFAPVGEPLEKNGEPMYAFFPAGNFVWDTDHVQFTMPAAFESLNAIMNPMAAVVPADATAETSVTLLNLGAIYEIRAYTDNAQGETLTKVELSNSKVSITGSATVSFSEGIPSIGALGGNKFVTCELAAPVTLSSTPKSVYFFLPVTGTDEFDHMTVKLVYGKTVGSVEYEPFEFKTRNSPMIVTRSMRKHMNFNAAGFFSGGDGSEGNPYLIASVDDFKAIKTKMESTFPTEGGVSGEGTFFGSTGVHYQQTTDINFENNDITANMIGTSTVPFKGTYDGGGNALQNVSITAAANNAGVFGYVDGGTIKKLTVSGSIASSKDNVGAIVGQMKDGTISGCASSATIDALSSVRVGGIVGYMVSGTIGSSDGTPTSAAEGTAFSANGCVNTGAITGKQHVGGIVGQMGNGLVSICRNAANVTADAYNAGGIVGYMQGGTIRLCYSKNAVTISGPYQIGGLAGYVATTNPIVIINSSSKSNVTSTGYDATYFGAVGGLVGCMASNGGKTCALANSVAWASDVINTSNANAYVGGIVGRIRGSKKAVVRNCYSMHNGQASSSGFRVGIKIGDADLTFGTNCGGVFGYLENGEVDDCYWTQHNLVQSAGKETGTVEDKSVTNVQSMSNAAKNGTEQFATTVNYKNGRGKGTQYLYEHLRRGSYSTSSGSTLFSYTGFTTESSCAWGQKETFGASSNGKNAIPVAIGYLPMGTNGWWQQ